MSAARDERMREEGYWPAPTPGHCCLCGRMIHRNQWIRRMPDSWKPESRRRHAHWRCLERLREQIRARAEASR